MSNLLQLIESAALTGEPITLAYAGGSRPGQARDIIVLSCNESDITAVEPPSRTKKCYKVNKIIWAKTKGQEDTVVNQEAARLTQQILPPLETLVEYAAHLRQELSAAGWWIEANDTYIHVGDYFKNGKPRKTPRFSVTFCDRTVAEEFDPELGDFVIVKRELSGLERPWRVDSWRFSDGKTYRNLSAAIQAFYKEIRETKPRA